MKVAGQARSAEWGSPPGADALLEKLGKHKRGKGCLYISKLSDVDVVVLERLVGKATKSRGRTSGAYRHKSMISIATFLLWR
jgi:hypothetical protein